MTTSAGPAVVERRVNINTWDRLRLLLIVAWLLVAAGALVLGERPSSRASLEQGLSSARVTEVTVVGSGRQEVHWRDGLVRRFVEVRRVGPGASGDAPIGSREIGVELVQAHPDLRVVRVDRPVARASIEGWLVPRWVAALALVASLLALVVVVAGWGPWRATRWAWFWLLCTPVGMVAFLLLAGPTYPLPEPKQPDRRLTAGWAFLLAGLLGGGIAASR